MSPGPQVRAQVLPILGLRWVFSPRWFSALEVQCTNVWICVRIKPTIFPSIYAEPFELFLGNDCPVTDTHPEFYEFLYGPSECGIISHVFQNFIMFVTKIRYFPNRGLMEAEMPVRCVMHKGVCGWHLSHETKGRIHLENEDMEVASAMQSGKNVNVTFPCVSK
uniref:ZP domain-containing protein n=1 Tax=Otolemur garnettii TaxID=30611 RepID=H0XNX7_OTOGA